MKYEVNSPKTAKEFSQQLEGFVLEVLDRYEKWLLIDGLLPAVVRGHRLNQDFNSKDKTIGTGQNYAHFIELYALARKYLGKNEYHERIFKTIYDFLGRPLIPFPHHAILSGLESYGALPNNALFQSFDSKKQLAIKDISLNLDYYYNTQEQKMHSLPANYYWITATNAKLISNLLASPNNYGEVVGNAALNKLLEIFKKDIWFDDNPPNNVVDQYAWETFTATVILTKTFNREDALEQLIKPAKAYLNLLIKLIRPDGYALNWGRSAGIISYGSSLYTLITLSEFLHQQSKLSKKDFANNLAIAHTAFKTIVKNWFDEDGLTTMHKFGREPYYYRRSHRLLGTSFDTLVKFIRFAQQLKEIDSKYQLKLAKKPNYPNDFQYFEDFSKDERKHGLFIAKNKYWHINIPIVGNNSKANPIVSSNYLPALICPFISDVPTQQSGAYGTEYIEMKDGSTYAAIHACSEIIQLKNGIKLVWDKFYDIHTLAANPNIGKLAIEYELIENTLSCSHKFETKNTSIKHRYSALGIALANMEKLETDYLFWSDRDRLELKTNGRILKTVVEDVKDLPASKSFLTSLPWLINFRLPNTASEFQYSLKLSSSPKI